MNAEKQNKMEVMPMGRLVFSMAFPMMISMLVQAFYNVVDSLFVSHIASTALLTNASDKAVQALTLAFPIQMLMIACNAGTGVGISAVLSRYLGQKNRDAASRVAGNGIFLAGIIYLLFLLFGLFGAKAFILTQTTDMETAQMSISYLRICTICAFGTMGYFAYEKILQATGMTTLAMIAQLAGALVNILLDPVFIFGWFGIPALGVAGAAIATVLGQCFSLLIGMIVYYRFNHQIDHGLRFCRPDLELIRQIYQIGFPAIVMNAMTSIMAYGMNLLLGSVSTAYVTAFGIYYKLQNFIYMPVFGLNNALVPITGFSYGARSRSRIRQSLRWGLTDAMVIMGIGILLMQCFASQIVSCFSVSGETQTIGISALRIISSGYLFAGINIILQGYCQALGNGVYSLVISLLRMAVVLLPLVWLLLTSGHAEGVWLAFPMAEFTALVAAVCMARHLNRVRSIELTAAPTQSGQAAQA